MKLTIDTQHDTYEDIQKVLHILTGLIQHKEKQEAAASNSPTADTTDLMSMFSGSASLAPAEKTDTSAPPDFSSFLNLTKKEEKKENISIPKIEFF